MIAAAPRRGRGKSQKSLDLIEAAHRILAEIAPASVRAVCYRLFNEKLIASMAKGETNRVGDFAVLRYGEPWRHGAIRRRCPNCGHRAPTYRCRVIRERHP